MLGASVKFQEGLDWMIMMSDEKRAVANKAYFVSLMGDGSCGRNEMHDSIPNRPQSTNRYITYVEKIHYIPTESGQ
jgi:hypothetical protein